MNSGFTLKECLFGPVKLTKNADPDKYYHWGYGVGFDPCSSFSVPNFDWVRILLFLQYTIVHQFISIIRRNTFFLVLGKDPTEGLDDTTITAEAEFSINVLKSQRTFSFSIHCNGGNRFLSING